MAGTKEGGEKAAANRGEASLREAGRKGAESLNRDPQKKSEASQKGAATRGHDNLNAANREGSIKTQSGKREEED